MKEAQQDSVSDFKKFKKDSEAKIKDNEKKIADLKVKHSQMGAKELVDHQNKVSALEQKNTKLKSKLSSFKEDDSKGNWESFKVDFKHDMDELGKAMKDFSVNNKK